MAGKKKKPAANPARGFATTSIASKPKGPTDWKELKKEANASEAARESGTSTLNTAAVSEPAGAKSKELHELSPEELEKELEKNDLQLLLDTIGPKVKKESSRQITRVQTDRRILRNQAQDLYLRDWLPEVLIDEVIELAKADIRNDESASKQGVSLKSMPEDEAINRLWTLQDTLVDLGIPKEQIETLLRKLISNPPSETKDQVWGFPEALDMLALESIEKELPAFEGERPKPGWSNYATPVDTPSQSSAPTPRREASPVRTDASSIKAPSIATPATSVISSDDDFAVSDLDSDVEGEELIATYLATKARLYEINPDLVSEPASKGRSGKKWKKLDVDQRITPGILKLQKKLKQIESDILFDQREANAQWVPRRTQLAQEAVSRKRFNLDNEKPKERAAASNKPEDGSAAASVLDEANEAAMAALTIDGDGDDLITGLFSAEPGAQSPMAADEDTPMVIIRDFGKSTGMNPRRVLEEACKSRDQTVKLSYKQVSPTTYSCRHSLTITWAKDQDPLDPSIVPSIICDWQSRSMIFAMKHIACPDVAQSESFIATAALFLIFSSSPKDEKVFMRLPPTWRELWSEFLEARKDQTDAAGRDTIKNLRGVLQDEMEREAEDGVVLTGRFRRRNEGAATPTTDGSNTMDNFGSQYTPEQLSAMWHAKQSTPSYQRMLVSRLNLPMFRFKEQALRAIEGNQVLILCGETGCGKSTQMPAFILEHELSQGRDCKIYCTEPRRISAMSLAQRVSEELGEHKNDLGTNRSLVGYAIRLESHVAQSTRLVYATVGIVLRMLESDRGLGDITHLVIDEVHERSIDTDFLLVVLQSLMIKRPNLKVVLMSATVDAEKFSKYLGGAPVITVPGRTFSVQARFLEDAIEITGHRQDSKSYEEDADDDRDSDPQASEKSLDSTLVEGYSKQTRNTLASYDEYRIDYDLIVELMERIAYDPAYVPFSKAVLVFMPGMAEIKQLNDILTGHPSFGQGWQIYPLHSTIASEDQQQAFVVPPPGIRKIVIATNIAETGITIPDVTCVIDTGKHKEMRFDERRQLSRLIQSFISRANAKQRRGRAGRVQEGICFHLFTRYRHDSLMADQQTPEMLRLSLQDLVMRVKICQLGEIEQTLAQALDPPLAKNVRRAIDALVEVGALTGKEELTPLGRQLAKLPLDAQLGKLCLLASLFGCLDIAITIAAILSSKSPFLTPFGARTQADAVRLGFKKGDSDVLTAYNAYSSWRRVCTTGNQNEYTFCRKNFLSPQNLAAIEDLKSQLLSGLVDAGFVTLTPDDRTTLSRYRYASRNRTFVPVPAANNANNESELWAQSVIAAAFYPKLLARDGKGWRNIASNASVSLHPTSVNKGNLEPALRYLSYYSIMQSSSRSPQAQSTTALPSAIPLLLLVGEAEFKVHAGVVVLDSGRLRFKLRTWRATVALKVLRRKVREIVEASLERPGRPLGGRLSRWMGVVERMFVRDQS